MVKVCYGLAFSVDRKLEWELPFGKDVNIADPVEPVSDISNA